MSEWILTSSVLIAAIMLVRRLLKGRIKLWLQYSLWLLVLLRLLIPVSLFDSAFSVMNAASLAKEEIADTVIGEVSSAVWEMAAPVKSYDQAYEEVREVYEEQGIDISELSQGQLEELEYTALSLQFSGPKVSEIVKFVWIAGMVIVGSALLISNLRFAAKLRRSRERIDIEQSGTEMSGAEKLDVAVRCDLPVYVSELVDTPCLFGVLHPAIYLTGKSAENPAAFTYVLEHESTHYRHGDHIWSLLRCVCLALHWYNPLVWKAAKLSRQDSELACDESTIRSLGEDKRIDYGKTIISLSCGKAGAKSLLTAATTMVGSEHNLKERVIWIAKRPKTAVWAGVAVLSAAVMAAACTFTGTKEEKITGEQAVLWDADKQFSCAKFEDCLEDSGGFKLITSEIHQFDSLNYMNLIPAEKTIPDTWYYRVTFDWNGVAVNGEEYVVEVGAHCLTVNGNYYVADGFAFESVLEYFVGKYEYFDYELQYSLTDLGMRADNYTRAYVSESEFHELYQSNPSQPDYINALYSVYNLSADMELISNYWDGGNAARQYESNSLWMIERLRVGLECFDVTEGQAPDNPKGKRVTVASADGNREMIFYTEEPDIFSYREGEAVTYWHAAPNDDTHQLFLDSIGAWAHRIFSEFDASAQHEAFSFNGTAEEISGEFAENVYRRYFIERMNGGYLSVDDYDVIEWSLADVSKEGDVILGWIKYAVKPEDPTPRTASFWTGGAVDGEGEYEGWVIQSVQFLLEQQEDGQWEWETAGYFGNDLSEIFGTEEK